MYNCSILSHLDGDQRGLVYVMEAQAQHGALGVERAVRRVEEVVLLLVRGRLVGGQHGGQLVVRLPIRETDLDLDLGIQW